jgi:hypothetical protein
MSVRIEVDMSDVMREFDRLKDMPNLPMISGLEGVLATTFAETQLTTPVDTGSLRGSGKISSEVTEDRWDGAITYGGASPGFPHDPVTYAWFVLGGHIIVAWGRRIHEGKQYQEPDNFMAPWDVGEQDIKAAILREL